MDALVAAWRSELEKSDALDDEAIARQLSLLVEQGRAAWSQLAVPAEAFVRRLARHWPGDEPLGEWAARLRLDDLYLATACENRVPGAVEAFERTYLTAVPAILRRGAPAGANVDEIRQRVRERLFVTPAKIADYSGRGALASWLEVVTLRIAIDIKRQERGNLLDSVSAADQIVDADPELEFIKERYRDAFKRGLRTSLRALEGEYRNLLKLHFVDELTLDQMATLFRVHRATIARRIATAREQVFDGLRAHLERELSLDEAEFESLLRLVRSRIDLSLSLLMAESLA
jgi:RNA polymerase sigma-70 factor